MRTAPSTSLCIEKFSFLGDKCRLFAEDEVTLARFDAVKYLTRLSDYVHCTSIRRVPDKLRGYAIYQREQPKTSKERLARRYASRHKMEYEAALQCYSKMPQKPIPSPFIRLQSLSSDKVFCLWIKKTLVAQASGGTFSSYGLSATASVPEF